MKETRLLIFSEDFGEGVLVLTNLSDHKLYNLMVQFDEDREDNIQRSLKEIVEHFAECEILGYTADDFIKEYTDTFDELDAVKGDVVCYYSCFQFNEVK